MFFRIWPPNPSDGPANYDIWAACITEVEVDVLTGEKNVVRTDIIQDTGMSMSPEVDLGQIEGAFVMALGLWTSEEIKFDPQTGRLLTRDTWVRIILKSEVKSREPKFIFSTGIQTSCKHGHPRGFPRDLL